MNVFHNAKQGEQKMNEFAKTAKGRRRGAFRLTLLAVLCAAAMLPTAAYTTSLPDGYMPARYIQSTSAHQYIDTGYTHGTNDLVVVDYYAPRSWQDKPYCTIFGSKTSNPNSAENWYFYIAGANWSYFGYCHNTTKYAGDSSIQNYNYNSDPIHLECQARTATWTCNGSTGTLTTDSTSASWTAGRWPIYIFTSDTEGSPGNDFYTVMRLYSFKVYRDVDGEMVLQRDMVPCINPSGAAGLYDLVNGQFYGNAREGTEDFIAGVEYDSLPNGFTAAEYIQSTTNHQYIDTGYLHGTNDLVVMEYYAPKTWQDNGYCYLFGSRGAGSGHTNRENWFFYIGGKNQDIIAYNHQNFADATNPATYDYESPRIRLECQASTARWSCGALNGSFTTSTTFSNWTAGLYPLYIFGADFGGSFNSGNSAVMRLYSFKVYRDVDGEMVLQRDMVPCVSHTGAAGLYDKVGRRFYGNARDGVEDFDVCTADGLPDGYIPAKYIQSTSAHQYINTGYTHGTNDLVVADYYAPRSWQDYGYCYIFGSKDTAPNSPENWYFFIAGKNQQFFGYGHNNAAYVSDANIANYDYDCNPVHLECQARTATWTCNGRSGTLTTASTTWTAGRYPLYIFTGNNGGSVGEDFCTSIRLYSFKIYRDIGGQMVLVRDFVPCLNENGAAGLFDKVGRRFHGNARSGGADFRAYTYRGMVISFR